MTLLAHWPIDDAPAANAVTARDIAAGGSGSHDGTYVNIYNSKSYGRLVPGGVGGLHAYHSTGRCDITSIGNPADLRLLGELTIAIWLSTDGYYYWNNHAAAGLHYIINVSGLNDTEAENDLWDLYVPDTNPSARVVTLRWEQGAGVDVVVPSDAELLRLQGWTHIVVERYQVSLGKFGVRFYKDGVLFSTKDNGGAGYDPPTGGGNSLPMIGRNATTATNRPFSFDSVRVYDTAIGDVAAKAIYDSEVFFFDDLPVKDDWAFEFVGRYIGVCGDRYNVVESGPNSKRTRAGFSRFYE